MLAITPMEQLISPFAGVGGAGLLVLMVVGLLYCFFGYALFRVLLVLAALAAGAMLGFALMAWRVGAPNGLDILIGCGACSILLALLAWFWYRVFFSLGAGMWGWAMTFSVFGAAPSSWVSVPGVLVGLALAVLAFMYTRQLVVFLFSLLGGAQAVVCGAALVAGGTAPLSAATVGPDGNIWLLLLVILSGIVVSVAGMYLQLRLARLFRRAMTPGIGRGGKNRRRGRTDLRPRFSRL